MDNILKKVKWGILFIIAACALLLCSCTQTPPSLTDLVTLPELTDIKTATATATENKEYKELLELYKKCDGEYFEKTRTAVGTLIGQRYAYAVTAYDHSKELSDIAEMFFDDTSENTLSIYFALRGFEDREYTADEHTAKFSCRKNEDQHVYTVEYETAAKTINVTHTVNGEKKDHLGCKIDDDGLYKECYSGSLQRTFVSRVNKDGTSKIEWYDKDVTDNPPAEDEEHGYVVFDGLTLSGVIK